MIEYTKLSGVEKVAIIMLSLDEQYATKLLGMMTEEEVKEITFAMSSLGSVGSDVVEHLIAEFSGEIGSAVSLIGNLHTAEQFLAKVMNEEQVSAIMEEIRGPAGKNTWDKLGNVNEDVLASYLKNEYPQTVALIVSKLSPAHAARVLSALPQDLTSDVMIRMLKMESIKKEVLDNLESTLRAEFISTLAKTQKYNSEELMAEIFNNFDRNNEAKYMAILESEEPDYAERIKSLMFTFDDLINIDSAGIQVLVRNVDKQQLTVALKGATDKVRSLFLDNMSQRAAKIMSEDIEALGPVRMRDVDEAQMTIVQKAKDLANKGELVIADRDAGDEYIY